MGLYDDRLADLSESRRGRGARRPMFRSIFARRPAPVETPRKSMRPQSLLFSRSAGWTPSKAKEWAKSHGYKHGKADVTEQYVRIRQFNPKGSAVSRTIPFGRGIRAVVARESSGENRTMARTKVAAKRRRRRSRKSAPAPKRRRRRARKARAVATRRRRRRVRVEVKAARRRRAPVAVAAPRRRRRRRRMRAAPVKAWRGNSAGHRKAARKGWRKKRRSSKRRRRRVRAVAEVAAPRRRRRRRHVRATSVVRSSRPRRRYMRASVMGSAMELGTAVLAGGLGFVLADGLDRFLATYDPSSTGERPKDKFTSDGAGTLANTLNIARMPGWVRAGASVGMVAVPAVGSSFIRNRTAKRALEGMALGAGVNAFKLLVNNVLLPMLIGKDTSAPALQKNVIARLYPAEVAAKINMDAQKGADGKTLPGPYNPAGVLSGNPDVGPFALSGDSPYPDAAQALRRAAGVGGDSPYASASDALRRAAGVSGDSPYANVDQALRRAAGVGYEPGPPAGQGPGPRAIPGEDSASCGCIGEGDQYSAFLGLGSEEPLMKMG